MRDFDDILAIDPLYILLGPKIFELLHRPEWLAIADRQHHGPLVVGHRSILAGR